MSGCQPLSLSPPRFRPHVPLSAAHPPCWAPAKWPPCPRSHRHLLQPGSCSLLPADGPVLTHKLVWILEALLGPHPLLWGPHRPRGEAPPAALSGHQPLPCTSGHCLLVKGSPDQRNCLVGWTVTKSQEIKMRLQTRGDSSLPSASRRFLQWDLPRLPLSRHRQWGQSPCSQIRTVNGARASEAGPGRGRWRPRAALLGLRLPPSLSPSRAPSFGPRREAP